MLDDLKDRVLDDPMSFWPVAHWRPERHEDITPDLCFKVAAVQSPLAFAVLALASLASGHEAFARFGAFFAVLAVAIFITFYVILRVALAGMWNRRARALRGGGLEATRD